MAAGLFEELSWRGMVSEHTEGLRELLAAGPVTGYIGFDPTADSLHAGSLLTVMGLARLQRFGHSPIAIVGGGTGMIGDPSGKSQERTLLSAEQIDANVAGIRRQLERFLDFDRPGNPARIVNNAEWLSAFDLLGFLRDTGKYFTVNYMLQKESVNRRLESEDGISYTEFSYLLLQARDFLELLDRYGCTLQMGGTDQWGNITAGIDLVRKLRARRVHGLVWPLMTTSTGAKFGKTEAGAVWLDPKRTSPFRFYQFWLNTDDRDVERYLKLFTFLRLDRIAAIMAEHGSDPGRREAQRNLAREVTAAVHGSEAAESAIQTSLALFSGSADDGALPAEALADMPERRVSRAELPAGLPVVEVLVASGLASSKADARRGIQGKGFYLNGRPIEDVELRIGEDSLQGPPEKRFLILRKGKKNYVRLVLDP